MVGTVLTWAWDAVGIAVDAWNLAVAVGATVASWLPH